MMGEILANAHRFRRSVFLALVIAGLAITAMLSIWR